eukprot:TRINITY_DN4456_c0_g2_i5.p1 TRINITY_DN4456_c0_g2~~TRINITY_DN4456_c0_g2_i5.p1  ORF type:complete len:190 (+),score=31.46 TRINITY_DN4456_c0_g2_i5:45-572(+)
MLGSRREELSEGLRLTPSPSSAAGSDHPVTISPTGLTPSGNNTPQAEGSEREATGSDQERQANGQASPKRDRGSRTPPEDDRKRAAVERQQGSTPAKVAMNTAPSVGLRRRRQAASSKRTVGQADRTELSQQVGTPPKRMAESPGSNDKQEKKRGKEAGKGGKSFPEFQLVGCFF